MTSIDELNDLLDEAADVFDRANAGSGATCEVTLEPNVMLRWMKHGAEWGFHILRKPMDDITALEHTSMRTRMLAAKNLPKLWEALELSQEAQGAAIEIACENVRKFIKQHT